MLIARPATPGLWFDSSVRLNLGAARIIKSYGYIGVVRYWPLPGNLLGEDLAAPELLLLTKDAGLQVMGIQHTRYAPWDPTNHDGYKDAQVCLEWADQAEYPNGAHVWCDFEGIKPGVTSAVCKTYIEDFGRGVREGERPCGMYCGFDDPLTPEELYLLHGINSYWSDAGHRKVATRGVSMSQGPQITVDGVPIDSDQLQKDLLGEVPYAATWID